jgi:hypothetical protein
MIGLWLAVKLFVTICLIVALSGVVSTREATTTALNSPPIAVPVRDRPPCALCFPRAPMGNEIALNAAHRSVHVTRMLPRTTPSPVRSCGASAQPRCGHRTGHWWRCGPVPARRRPCRRRTARRNRDVTRPIGDMEACLKWSESAKSCERSRRAINRAKVLRNWCGVKCQDLPSTRPHSPRIAVCGSRCRDSSRIQCRAAYF